MDKEADLLAGTAELAIMKDYLRRNKGETVLDAVNKINRLTVALKRIIQIPNGPDRGSAQSQIDCAVIYAREALMEKPTEGNKEDLYI